MQDGGGAAGFVVEDAPILHVIMLSADDFAFSDKEHLHDDILLFFGKRNNIPVFHIGIRHLLLLFNHPDAVPPIPVFCRILKAHLLRSLFHLFRQVFDDRTVISA